MLIAADEVGPVHPGSAEDASRETAKQAASRRKRRVQAKGRRTFLKKWRGNCLLRSTG
jgi:hypothetical protein